MKRKFLMISLLIAFTVSARAQTYEVEQLLLDWDKLSALKHILSDLYQGYEVLRSGYDAIKDISEGNFNLHKAFLDGLLLVSPAVRNYRHVKEMVDDQSALASEYKAAWKALTGNKHFTTDELIYIGHVYTQLFIESLKDIDRLTGVLTAGALRMSDAERLDAIDVIFEDGRNKLLFLRRFNDGIRVLSQQRDAEQKDVETLKGLYGAP